MKGYRTLIFACCALGGLVAGLWIVGSRAVPAEVYGSFAWSVVGLTVAVAGKSSVGALAAGGGVKGAVQALMTDAPPGGTK
jgi:hypothetical protein